MVARRAWIGGSVNATLGMLYYCRIVSVDTLGWLRGSLLITIIIAKCVNL